MKENKILKGYMSKWHTEGSEWHGHARRVFRRSDGYPDEEIRNIIERCRKKFPHLEVKDIMMSAVPVPGGSKVTHVWWTVTWINLNVEWGKKPQKTGSKKS